MLVHNQHNHLCYRGKILSSNNTFFYVSQSKFLSLEIQLIHSGPANDDGKYFNLEILWL